jgi:hypothetical protein
MKLPPIFQEHRLAIPKDRRPDVLLYNTKDLLEEYLHTIETFDANEKGVVNFSLVFWPKFWIEAKHVQKGKGLLTYACLVVVDTSIEPVHLRNSTVYVFTKNGKSDTFNLGDHLDVNNEIIEEFSPTMGHRGGFTQIILHSLFLFHIRMGEEHLPREQRRVKSDAPVYLREFSKETQDWTFRYYQAPRHTVAEAQVGGLPKPVNEPAPERHEPAFHKRQHDVIGHWRHYKSGKTAWIEGHKRGDPKLGTITRVVRL